VKNIANTVFVLVCDCVRRLRRPGRLTWQILVLTLATETAVAKGYLTELGPPPLRFTTLQSSSTSLFTDADIVIASQIAKAEESATKQAASAQTQSPETPEATSAPSTATNVAAQTVNPTTPGPSPPPANPTPAMPQYEFVLADPLLTTPNTSPTAITTNTVGPASDLLLVTPQMLVEFFKPTPGVTSSAPVRVLVPADIQFQPPLARPAPASQAIYRTQ
jgi:hypothetical protein